MRKATFLAMSVFIAGASPATHIEETLVLAKGWNAVYIESTPGNSQCEDFFRDTPVVAAAAYRSDADVSTAQYDTSGSDIVQAPIQYLQWCRGQDTSAFPPRRGRHGARRRARPVS